MLTLDRLFGLAAFVFAAAAFLRSRRVARRLERLTESYWDLRYEHGQLRARLARLNPEAPQADAQSGSPPAGTTAFVPLSSLKR